MDILAYAAPVAIILIFMCMAMMRAASLADDEMLGDRQYEADPVATRCKTSARCYDAPDK